jgi:CheY-like chemotaxis protein
MMDRFLAKGAHLSLARTILVVEDQMDEREATVHTLRELGYPIEVAASGSQAVKQALRHEPDVVVMDVSLPDMTGIEALRHIRASGSKRPHVIMMSGQVDGRTRQLAFEAGCDQYIVKPAGVETLASAVQAYFSKRDGRESA